MKKTHSNEILDTDELRNYLGIGRDKAYNLMKSKAFPSIKIGRTFFVTRDNLMKWLNESKGRIIEV